MSLEKSSIYIKNDAKFAGTVNIQIINVGVNAHGDEGAIKTGKKYSPLAKDPGRNGATFATPELLKYEYGNDECKSQETAPHLRIFPWIEIASPLKGQQQAYYGAYEEQRS